MLKTGDRVLHSRFPDWGPGEVLEVAGDSVTVHFVNAGEKKLKASFVTVVTDERGDHPLLDHLRKRAPRRGVGRKTVQMSISDFRLRFPMGFEDVAYLNSERNYKIAARDLLAQLLGSSEFRHLVQASRFDEVVTRALKVVNVTNLISPHEKMALNDGLRVPVAAEPFSRALFDLLHGEGDEEQRFEAWAAVLNAIESAKWPIASYFPYFANPDREMFIKPTATQNAADVCSYEINYKPELNWLTYRSVREFAGYLRNEVAALRPRDMIDVQSFMWCTSPSSEA